MCGSCSQKKAYLHYSQKEERVCEVCFGEYVHVNSLIQKVAAAVGGELELV